MTLPAKIVLPAAPVAYGRGYSWFETSIPVRKNQDKLADDLRFASATVCRFIREYSTEHPSSPKPIVTGFSQGGILSFGVALTCPDAVSLSIPIAGLLPEEMLPKKRDPAIPYPPIVALHGDADEVVPFEAGKQTVEILKKRGFDATLQTYGLVTHTISSEMQRDLYQTISEHLAGSLPTPSPEAAASTEGAAPR